MIDVLRVPVFRAADALFYSLERALMPWPVEEPIRDELHAAAVEILAQAIYVALRPTVAERDAAREALRRATRCVAILVDVARSRGRLGGAAAREITIRNAAVWHEARQQERRERARPVLPPRLPPRSARPPLDPDTLRDALPPTAVRRVAPTVLLRPRRQ
jgi:hypothetical protein